MRTEGRIGALSGIAIAVGFPLSGRTQPMIFSADETAAVGIDLATPVVEEIGAEARSRFTGPVPRVTIELRDASAATNAAVTGDLENVARRTE